MKEVIFIFNGQPVSAVAARRFEGQIVNKEYYQKVDKTFKIYSECYMCILQEFKYSFQSFFLRSFFLTKIIDPEF